MIANILRAETAESHKELEALMFVNEIMNKSLSIENYKKLLSINYIMHQRLEHKLANMLDDDIAEKLELKSRFKLSALDKDLAYWKIDPLTLPELDFKLFVPEKSNAAVLGALYVLEGATLGGNVIKKHILANPNFKNNDDGLNYYGVYAEEIISKWKSFVQILNQQVTEADFGNCVRSANLTFGNLIKLSKQLNS
ncbi:biliverdin-producing heme oxygenase [Pedobacter mendelii]|uniref:Heme oxygenase n=1 Tax=Pedobacter mendelii TaxID=1908240 RepID=A0ABQ2BJ57_9SPHI|nr:biliverdin-producing heme oxygenase [Pedobacter mendelii]GGI25886.1 heme oxygenase [Pedobacter mendelii]